jgi:DNA-binding GntR family transcriptional regulator
VEATPALSRDLKTVPGGREARSNRSLADVVVDYLRSAIIRGDIAPGARINIKEVQERFDVSHIPVREALRQLEAENLVVNIPRRGSIASPVSVDDLVSLYDLRRLIEPEVAARAARHMDDGRMRLVEQALAAVDASDRNSTKFIAADRAFHWKILEPGATPLIQRTLAQLWQSSERFVRIGLRVPTTAARTRQQHHEIVDAVRARDERTVRSAYRRHLTLTEDVVREISHVDAS